MYGPFAWMKKMAIEENKSFELGKKFKLM